MSPISESSKFEDIESGESDLEEGEIPEVDFISSKKKYPKKSNETDEIFIMKKALEGRKGNVAMSDVSSSDGEYVSNSESEKYYSPKISCKSQVEKMPKRKSYTQNSYGMVKNIMSQIDQTVSRKSIVSYKRRSKDLKHALGKVCKHRSHPKEHYSQEVSRGHFKTRHRRRSKSRDTSSDSTFSKCTKKSVSAYKKESERNGKRVKDVVSLLSDEESPPKKRRRSITKKRDFDECRKKLLEQLNKQKVSSEFKEKEMCQSIPLPVEEFPATEIQEIEMADDSNMFVDAVPPAANNEDSSENQKSCKSFMDAFYVTRNISNVPKTGAVLEEDEECGEDDDTELIKLRLLALTSNRRNRAAQSENAQPKTEETSPSQLVKSVSTVKSEGKESLGKDEGEEELIRNELLLRAEALKTALMKKHQKRLNKTNGSIGKNCSTEKEARAEVQIVPKSAENTTSPAREDRKNNDMLHAAFQTEEQILVESKEVSPVAQHPAESLLVKVTRSGPYLPNCLPHVDLRRDAASYQNNGTPAIENAVPINNRLVKKRLKRLKWKWKRSLKRLGLGERKRKNSKSINGKTCDKTEDDDEQLRMQLLSDLKSKKTLKENDKQSALKKSPPRPDRSKLLAAEKGKTKTASAATATNATGACVAGSLLQKVTMPEIERIIVHLGSESSDDEDEVGDGNKTKPVMVPNSSVAMPRPAHPANDSCGSLSTNKNYSVSVDYEKSVEILLMQARQKIEGNEGKVKTEMSTPEAVYKHLPPSQRLEYIRLKQKIAEREKLNKKPASAPAALSKKLSAASASPAKKVAAVNRISSTGRTEGLAPPKKSAVAVKPRESARSAKQGSLSSSSSSSDPVVKSGWSPLKNNGANLQNGTRADDVAQQKKKRIAQNQLNISKLKQLLKNIKIEKTMEEKYEKEMKRLSSQITILQMKRSQQRLKIQKMADESKNIYRTIQLGRNKNHTNKENVETSAKQSEIKKSDKAETAEEQVSKSGKLESEAGGSESNGTKPNQPECNEGTSKATEKENSEDVEDTSLAVSSTCVHLEEYNSPLQVFAAGTEPVDGRRIDPNTIMCQFDLTGVCKDEECTYQHLRTS